MESDPTPSSESSMSQSGPRNFYCHQCNSRTRVSIEEFTCSSCGSGFIEEIVESDADESRDGGAGANSDDPWAHDTEFDAEQERFEPHADFRSMIEDIFPRTFRSGIPGQDGSTSNDEQQERATRTRRSRHSTNSRASRAPRGPSIFVGNSGGPGNQFLQSLISNLTGMRGPGQFHFIMGGEPGSNVMYGNPGDYAWGRGGFDAIVTQMLNQMEGAGPPRMEKEDISSLPMINVTQAHIDQKTQCSVCWEDFSLDEMVNQLRCEHIFHKDCIKPWLELHATCPVCRKPQNEAATVHSRQTQDEATSGEDSNVTVSSSNFFGSGNYDNDSPMMEERSSQDPTPSTSTTSSIGRPNSTYSSTSEPNGPTTVPAEAEAAYSLGNPISTILNLFGQPSPSSGSSRTQFSFGFPSSTTSNTNPSQSNAFPQATSSSRDGNQESSNDGRGSEPPLLDVSSSSSTENTENCNSTTANGSRTSFQSVSNSTGNINTRLNTNTDRNSSTQASSSRNAPADFQDLDLE